MVAEFIQRVAMLSAIHAFIAGVAIGNTVVWDVYTVLDTAWDVPAFFDTDDVCWAGLDTRPFGTAWAWIKSLG